MTSRRVSTKHAPTDEKLRKFAYGFREGILEGRTSEMMCVAVCWPLQALLEAAMGLKTTLMCSDLGYLEHVWLRLPDGRCLDPTADQLNVRRNGQKFPPVYIGPVPYAHSRKKWEWAP